MKSFTGDPLPDEPGGYELTVGFDAREAADLRKAATAYGLEPAQFVIQAVAAAIEGAGAPPDAAVN